MKKLLLSLLLVSTSALANPINDMVHKVFSDLEKVSGTRASLTITGDPMFDARSTYGQVVISKGALRMMGRDKDMLAAILGHELSHIHNRDYEKPNKGKAYQYLELRSDKQGRDWANKAGYNGQRICVFMDKMEDAVGNPPPNDEHPSFEVRRRNLGCK